MSDLRELYQEVILDHTKHPRNFGEPDSCTHRAEGFNPVCGDEVTVYLEMRDGLVVDAHFAGKGCAISTASASLMTEAVKGKSASEATALFDAFHGVVTAPADAEIDTSTIGKLAVFAGVREFPMRVKCASLSWHTLCAAIRGDEEAVTTE